MLDFMPEQASNWAVRVDWINNLITYISVFCTLAITGAMLFFAIVYRRRTVNDATPAITHNAALETVWTVVPSVVAVAVFYYGFVVYREMRIPPPNSIEINVDAYKWGWDFQYANGKKSPKVLVVPLGKPVRLVMTSRDTLHSLFIPSMRVKEDVIPNVYSYLWFTPTPQKLGDHHIFCTEYCGTGHSGMLGILRVVTPEAFEDFLLSRETKDGPQMDPVEKGKEQFDVRGCKTCHSLDGSTSTGPSLAGLFGRKYKFPAGEIAVDENYVRESILNPRAKIVPGFEKEAELMPAFEGQLSEAEIKGLIAFLKTH